MKRLISFGAHSRGIFRLGCILIFSGKVNNKLFIFLIFPPQFHERYDPNLVYDEVDINNMLHRRALMARRITHEAALANRASISPSMENTSPFSEFYEKPLRKIHSGELIMFLGLLRDEVVFF